MNPFALALLDIAIEEQSSASLESIRNAAFAKMSTGEVKALVTSSFNGKSASFNISKPADELFAAVSWAIRNYNRGTVNAFSFDFSGL